MGLAAAAAKPIQRREKTMRWKRIYIALALALLCFSSPTEAYDYDANDFAIEVVDYVEGSGVGLFNEPGSAIGRPSLETGGEVYPDMEPVVPVYQPWLVDQLVTIGQGGQLTLKFSHPVANDKNNPYGIDFIIFGNAFLTIGGKKEWDFGNPEDVTVSGGAVVEPGIVSVSQDGVNWYSFEAVGGPRADTFAPTAGYEWDDVNDVWADELDPTRPVDPNLEASDLAGMTVAQVIEAYKGSAGGTGFDIEALGLDWIRYVRIEDDPDSGVSTEIDAIADVSCCGDYRHAFPVGDINRDCRVDARDLALVAGGWLDCTWDCP